MSDRGSIGWGTVAMGSLCGAVGGFLLGLFFATISGGKLSDTLAENEELTAQVASLEAQIEELRQPTAELEAVPAQATEFADWGILAELPQSIGPGTETLGLLTRLDAAGIWDASSHGWGIAMVGGTVCELQVPCAVVGEGKVYMELICTLRVQKEDPLDITVIFKPGETAELEQAVGNRNERLMAIANAAGLSAPEQLRLLAVLAFLPAGRDTAAEQAMRQFVEAMPESAQQRFWRCWSCLKNKIAAVQAGIDLRSQAPAVGFPLSDRYVAQVIFAPVASSLAYGKHMDYQKFGPWWSLVLEPGTDDWYTSMQGQRELGETRIELNWPRLSLEDVDAIREQLPLESEKR